MVEETNGEDRNTLNEGVIRSTDVEVSPVILPIGITLGVISSGSEGRGSPCSAVECADGGKEFKQWQRRRAARADELC